MQQRREELAALVAATRACAARQAVGVDGDRRTAVGAHCSARAELRQRIEQILDRPLAHARACRRCESAVAEAQRGDQEAHRRAGVADEELGRCRRDQRPPQPRTTKRSAAASRVDADAEPLATPPPCSACRR